MCVVAAVDTVLHCLVWSLIPLLNGKVSSGKQDVPDYRGACLHLAPIPIKPFFGTVVRLRLQRWPILWAACFSAVVGVQRESGMVCLGPRQ